MDRNADRIRDREREKEEQLQHQAYKLLTRAKMHAPVVAEFIEEATKKTGIKTAAIRRLLSEAEDRFASPSERQKIVEWLSEKYKDKHKPAEKQCLFEGLDALAESAGVALPHLKPSLPLLLYTKLEVKAERLDALARDTRGHYLTFRTDKSRKGLLVVVSELRRSSASSTEFVSARKIGAGKGAAAKGPNGKGKDDQIVVGGYLVPLGKESICILGASAQNAMWTGLVQLKQLGDRKHLVGGVQCVSEEGDIPLQAPFVAYRMADRVPQKSQAAELLAHTGVFTWDEFVRRFVFLGPDVEVLKKYLHVDPNFRLDAWPGE